MLHHRVYAVIAFLAVAVGTLLGQEPKPASPALPAARVVTSQPVSPASAALRDALLIQDPEEQLRALRKLRADFPAEAAKSPSVNLFLARASCSLVTPLLDEARRAADAYLGAPTLNEPDAVAWDSYRLATDFLRAGLWSDAERYGRRALAFWDRRPASQPAVMFRQHLRRSTVSALLGQALFEQDRAAEARPLLEAAFADRAEVPTVVRAVVPQLLRVAERENRAADQLTYLSVLGLFGALTPAHRQALEGIWKATHDGRIDGLEEMLDRRYLAEVPNLVGVEGWTRPSGTTGRSVLLEAFTGTSCAGCVAVDLALEGALRRYSRADVVVLAYHAHVPAPDPLVNPSSERRVEAYRVDALPTLVIDGRAPASQEGGGAVDTQSVFKNSIQAGVEPRLGVEAGARVVVEASGRAGVVRVKVRTRDLRSRASHVTLQVALVEEQVRFSGTNGVRFHSMVVRKLANDGAGFPLAGSGDVDCRFDLERVTRENLEYLDRFETRNSALGPVVFPEKKHQMDASRLAIVAFVQDASSREVLQAAWCKPEWRH